MIAARIEVDVEPVLAVLSGLTAPAFGQVATLALNDTAKNAQVQAAAHMAPAMGLPSREVKAALRVDRARPEFLEAALVASGRPIPMIRFRPQDTRRSGVRVRIGGDVETYRRAFITNVRNAHRGVFERVGRARLPLRELYGPSVPGYFRRTDVLPVVQRTMRDRLLVNLTRQLDRRLRREAGKARAAGHRIPRR